MMVILRIVLFTAALCALLTLLLLVGLSGSEAQELPAQRAALVSTVGVVAVGDTLEVVLEVGPGDDARCFASVVQWPGDFLRLVSWRDLGGCYPASGGVAMSDAPASPCYGLGDRVRIDSCSFGSPGAFMPQPCPAVAVRLLAIAPASDCLVELKGYMGADCAARDSMIHFRTPSNGPMRTLSSSGVRVRIDQDHTTVDVAPPGERSWGLVRELWR